MRICVLYDPECGDELPAIPSSAELRVIAHVALIEGYELRLAHTCADIVLLDLRVQPVRTGQIIAAVRLALPHAALLVVGAQNAVAAARAALHGGAAGYVTTDTSRARLVMVLQTIARGGIYVSRTSRRALSLDETRRALDDVRRTAEDDEGAAPLPGAPR